MISRFSIITAILFLFRPGGPAQDSTSAAQGVRIDSTTSAIFSEIEAGLRSGDINLFSRHLAKQVYLNLPEMEGGYFSDNQAAYILKDCFKTRRILSFKFSTVSVEATPFATGGGTYLRRGNPGLMQVYVALKRSGGQWVIAQFSVF